MRLLRSLLFYTGVVFSTVLFAPLSLLLMAIPFPARYRVMSCWAVFNLWWLRLCCGIRYEVRGLENIPEGACIILCKHQSAWETLALQKIFPPQVWVLKRELLRIPVYGWGLASLAPIAIDRSSGRGALRQIVSQGTQRLRQGLWVVIFPEGTRTVPGQRVRYKPGGGMLAAESGYPVLPVAHNSGYLWPRHSLIKWPGTITLVIGPVINSSGRSAADINRAAEDWIEDTVAALPDPNAVP